MAGLCEGGNEPPVSLKASNEMRSGRFVLHSQLEAPRPAETVKRSRCPSSRMAPSERLLCGVYAADINIPLFVIKLSA
ncbi:hypothetical protein ANN_05143 [Periplaneta americana]|uniref:Uncharacterized protein n=1 Tax=Periplaneta americana TaxID=6978 RepID=A0ABQ8TA96_PERAM|nr:hypothetical protein ANN_05143 [Periplaneta americana]